MFLLPCPVAALAGAWAWPVLTPAQWALAVLAGLCCGIAKAGLAGVGMMTVLIMADIFPGKLSSGVVLPLLIFADVMAAIMYRQEIHWARIRALFWPILSGIVIGWGVLYKLPDAAFKPLIGAMILLMLAVQIFRNRTAQLTGEKQGAMNAPAFTWGAGLLTGLSTMVANAAGPIASIYLFMLGLPKREFVATMAWLFLMVNLVKVPFSLHLGLISGGSLVLNLLLIPSVLLGMILGRAVVHRLPQRPFQIIILSLAGLAALRLLLAA